MAWDIKSAILCSIGTEGIPGSSPRMLHYKGDTMKKELGKKADIVILKDAKTEVMKKAPDEVIARAIHDVLLKGHEKKK